MQASVPHALRGYLDRSLPPDGTPPRQVRITQEGHMRQKPGGREMRFKASQRFAVERVAFSWRARFPIAGPLAIHVVDGYDAGVGELAVRLLGIRLRRQSGREISTGEAMRYLAELPWVPYAMEQNGELEWRELDEQRLEVATWAGDERVAVEMELDASGDVSRVFSSQRLLEVDGRWVPTPWAGEFSDYRVLGGMRLPTKAQVYWELDEGRFVYWRGRVTTAEEVAEPFAGR